MPERPVCLILPARKEKITADVYSVSVGGGSIQEIIAVRNRCQAGTLDRVLSHLQCKTAGTSFKPVIKTACPNRLELTAGVDYRGNAVAKTRAFNTIHDY